MRINPREVTNECEFCSNQFQVRWQYRKQRFCSVKCKCEWIKMNHWEEVNCLHCRKPFRRRKNHIHPRSGKNTMFCSNDCNRKSEYKKEKLRKWASSDKNHWRNSSTQKKANITKIKKYGTSNNMEGYKKTMIKKYGVPYGFWTGKKANGIRISKPQRKLYEEVRKQHGDALLESWLPDVQMSVDIYIPSKKRVIEFYGDYWHCNPKKYSPNYYNTQVHLKAKDIWKKDEQRRQRLETNGYKVEVIWENSPKLVKSP